MFCNISVMTYLVLFFSMAEKYLLIDSPNIRVKSCHQFFHFDERVGKVGRLNGWLATWLPRVDHESK